MAQVQCARGHIYNTEQYASCPVCNGSVRSIDFTGVGASDIQKTVPGAMASGQYGGYGAENIPGTVPVGGYAEDIKHTKPALKTGEREPIVGWLVCVDGKEKGKDYHIYGRMNVIGSDNDNDVCIKGDETISRKNQAQIGYDPRSNLFTLVKGNGKNLNYRNGAPVYSEAQLSAYDLLEIGKTKLLFVPFCSERFRWEEDTI